jgi:hypothetical protein
MNEPPHQRMARPAYPFLPPRRLPARLARLQSYWNDLRRGENAVPFSDDLDLSALPELSGNLMQDDVFESPQRFRFSRVGQELLKGGNPSFTGSFADEIEVGRPFEFFLAQASVTVEASSPTFYRHGASATGGKADDGKGYSRLLLPTWGNGRVSMLVGAVV